MVTSQIHIVLNLKAPRHDTDKVLWAAQQFTNSMNEEYEEVRMTMNVVDELSTKDDTSDD